MKNESFVSLVMLSASGLESIEQPLQQSRKLLDSLYSDFEIVVIGTGPALHDTKHDDRILAELTCVRYVQLSAHVHTDVAWAAGLETAIGDFVVLLNATSDPVDIIPELVSRCRSGHDVVIGTAEQPHSFIYSLFRTISNRLLRAIEYDLPRNATGLRCLSRRAVNSVTRTGRFHHQFYLRIQKTGFPSCAVPYRQIGPSSQRDFVQGFRGLLRLMVFNSSRPLRWMSMLGFGGSVAAFLFATYSVLLHLITGNIVQGWTTTILFMSLLFMLQFIMMAFFGEYLGRMMDDRSEQSDYSVVYEKNSSVMVNADRVNVLHDSVSDHSVLKK
jgi:hypothetical protein